MAAVAGEGQSLRLLEFNRAADAPRLKPGTRISRVGAVARVLEGQRPVFLADVAEEMAKRPELAPFTPESVGREQWNVLHRILKTRPSTKSTTAM